MITTIGCLADLTWPRTLEEAFTARRLASFARPLIAKFIPDNNNNSSIITSNYYNYNSPPTEKEIARELVEFFVFKVFGKSFIGDSLGNLRLTESERISVLCLRITINVIANSQLADTLSANHMHVIADISEDSRKFLTTDAPNEPVLSEAAAQTMSEQSFQTGFINSLQAHTFISGIDSIFSCEVVAQYLLIMCRDAVKKSLKRPSLFPTFNVKDFLKCMNTRCIPANISRNQNISSILDGLIAFNHFSEIEYTPTIEDITKLFLRQTAIQCKRDQAGIDLIIPILLKNKEVRTRTIVTRGRGTAVKRSPAEHGVETNNKKLFLENIPDVTGKIIEGEAGKVKKLEQKDEELWRSWNAYLDQPCDKAKNN
eukprot:gene4784-9520_t